MIYLYHGSTVTIDRIDLQKSRPNKDLGRGFYLSEYTVAYMLFCV